MIDLFKFYLGWDEKDFLKFKKVYLKYLQKHRQPNFKFYLYGKEYLHDNLALFVLKKDQIQYKKIFLSCLIFNSYNSDLYNLEPSVQECVENLDEVFNELISLGLYSSKEIFYIRNFLIHPSTELVYFEDYHSDYLLYNDFRNYFKILILSDKCYVKHSDNLSSKCINSFNSFSKTKYLKEVRKKLYSIKDEDLKKLYLQRVNKFLFYLSDKEINND